MAQSSLPVCSSLRPAEFLCSSSSRVPLYIIDAAAAPGFPATVIPCRGGERGEGGLLQGGGEGERGGCSCRRGQLVMQGCRGNNELAL